MSLIQVVQGHGAQCTLVDCSPRIHRSFLFPDMVQAALPWGARRSMTSPLFVRAYVRVAKGAQTSTHQHLLQTVNPSGPPAIHFVNMLYDTVDIIQTTFSQGCRGHHRMYQHYKLRLNKTLQLCRLHVNVTQR